MIRIEKIVEQPKPDRAREPARSAALRDDGAARRHRAAATRHRRRGEPAEASCTSTSTSGSSRSSRPSAARRSRRRRGRRRRAPALSACVRRRLRTPATAARRPPLRPHRSRASRTSRRIKPRSISCKRASTTRPPRRSLSFLSGYANSPLADNAQYWLAQSHYVQRQFNVALPEFQKVVDKYPQSVEAARRAAEGRLLSERARQQERRAHRAPASDAPVPGHDRGAARDAAIGEALARGRLSLKWPPRRSTRPRTRGSRSPRSFISIQGEAAFSGWPTVFVRLTGCPLRCQYCDTAYAFTGGEWRTFDEIVAEIRALRHAATSA